VPRPRLPFSLYDPGLPLGSLIHLQGPAATEALLRLLANHAGRPAAWVEGRLSAYPPGFAQRGVDLRRLLFVEAREQAAWAATELVRSQAFPLVAVAAPLPDERSLQRLQLAAEQARAVVVLQAALPEGAWAVRTRLHAHWEGACVKVRMGAEESVDVGMEVGA
jgi:hypothetical protein